MRYAKTTPPRDDRFLFGLLVLEGGVAAEHLSPRAESLYVLVLFFRSENVHFRVPKNSTRRTEHDLHHLDLGLPL